MSASPRDPGPRAQVRVPAPCYGESTRAALDEPVEASLTTNHVRLLLPDGAVDLVPEIGASTARPSDLGLSGGLFVINAGTSPLGAATAQDAAAGVAALTGMLDRLGWEFQRALVFPASLAWVEFGVALTGLDESDLDLLTHGRGLPGVHVWDDDGLSFWPSSSLAAIRGPIPVSIRPVEPGCPMRLLNRDATCVPEGGPWVSASRERRMWWDAHRALLVSAFGCPVCDGGRVGTGGAVALVEQDLPTRLGGWRPGSYRAQDSIG